jgi:hypothetical protein
MEGLITILVSQKFVLVGLAHDSNIKSFKKGKCRQTPQVDSLSNTESGVLANQL